MNEELETITEKLDSLGLWEVAAPYNWAVKPRGVSFPYFCTLMGDSNKSIRHHFMLLEGWQTFHDYVRLRFDSNFGFYTTPAELPHFEVLYLSPDKGPTRYLRHDPGYVPRNLSEHERSIVAKILWEAYGVMLRIESDPNLTLKYAPSQAIFARIEGTDGTWRDEPLPIPQPRPHIEKFSVLKADVAKAKDMPFEADWKIALDLRVVANEMTCEERPRFPYELIARDCDTKAEVFRRRAYVNSDEGLRGIWEGMPGQVVRDLLELGKVPGEIQVRTQRIFRMLRPLVAELPFKLSLHDKLEV